MVSEINIFCQNSKLNYCIKIIHTLQKTIKEGWGGGGCSYPKAHLPL